MITEAATTVDDSSNSILLGGETAMTTLPQDNQKTRAAELFSTVAERLRSISEQSHKAGGRVSSFDLVPAKPSSTHKLTTDTTTLNQTAIPVASPNFSNDPRDTNPYAYRADELGPSHGIPGLALLSDVLAPPGWKLGDAPIQPHVAEELYNISRRVAKETFTSSCPDTSELPEDERERLNTAQSKKWAADFKLDKLLLEERVKIYREYVQRGVDNNRQLESQRKSSVFGDVCDITHRRPGTLDPPTTTSIPYQYGDLHLQHPNMSPSKSSVNKNLASHVTQRQ